MQPRSVIDLSDRKYPAKPAIADAQHVTANSSSGVHSSIVSHDYLRVLKKRTACFMLAPRLVD
jgi:hypothetical protein